MKKKNYVDTQDFSKEELLDIMHLGLLIKENLKKGSIRAFRLHHRRGHRAHAVRR